jgi:hypothetical protein
MAPSGARRSSTRMHCRRCVERHLPDVFDSAVYEQLHMAFYPAITADATELRFTSHGTVSRTRHPELSDDTSLLPDVHFDPFTWRLVIPR